MTPAGAANFSSGPLPGMRTDEPQLIGGERRGSKEKEGKEEEMKGPQDARMESPVSSTGFPSWQVVRPPSDPAHGHAGI
jgi:hypothetical protein